MNRYITGISLFLACLLAISCGQAPSTNATNATGERTCSPISDTPTEAYKRLFAAVKQKDTDGIRGIMSKKSQDFAQSLAERQKKPIAEVFANGFTGTTFADELPTIRDERVAGCFGAVEVRNDKDNRWEDLPWVNEDGTWKLAIGEMFSNSFKSPGKSQEEREREAANTARGNVPMAPNPIANSNTTSNANLKPPGPKYDGPQVEPLPKKK